ncbi:MAG: dTDP-4-dehydrorhamnose reductase [Chloroflexi bacterium]|nr:MAG: dTDP-4-dehydrorhamnose reductase [Chloroflexota bacterium]
MRVVVTGAGGQLGRELVPVLTARGHVAIGLTRRDCDVTDAGGVGAALEAHRPDVVVNCAAWTRVDAAESDPDAAYRVNALGPRTLAEACVENRVRLCHLSTDYVFDGSSPHPIAESVTPRPLNVYGASKLAGENEVRRVSPDSLVVRTSWLYGQDGPNFVLSILRRASQSSPLRVVDDQHGCPTWTGHLAPALVRLLERGVGDAVVHLTNSGETTWHGFAEATLAEADCPEVPVTAVSSADYGGAARRPSYSVLDNRVWRLLGEAPLPPWQEGLRAYLARRPPR